MPRTDRNRLAPLVWIALALVVAALLGVTVLWAGTRREAAALRDWQAAILRQIGQAAPPGVSPTAPTPADARDALRRIVAARDAALAMAAAPLPLPTVAPASDAPDGDTAIARLRTRRSTGTAAGDAQAIERDSRAAWTGWK